MQEIKIMIAVLLLLAVISAGSLIKERKMKIKNMKMRKIQEKRTAQKISDDESSMWIPIFPAYRFQYSPVLMPDHRMFVNFEDVHGIKNEDPDARSFGPSKSLHPDTKTMFRRAVLLWPRPCGWEWDGNMYRWGPCNTFFGGPGFPW